MYSLSEEEFAKLLIPPIPFTEILISSLPFPELKLLSLKPVELLPDKTSKLKLSFPSPKFIFVASTPTAVPSNDS